MSATRTTACQAQDELLFQEKTHTYTLNGRELPSVTQILDEAGFIDPTWFTEESTQRGTDVHLLTRFHDDGRFEKSGDLEESLVSSELRGYFEAWKEFRRVSRCKVLAIELMVWHDTLWYAGMLDRLLAFDGHACALIDIKTGGHAPWHALQTAGYAVCPTAPPVTARYSVYLRSDGTFKLKRHEDPADLDVFRAALACSTWKRNQGVAG